MNVSFTGMTDRERQQVMRQITKGLLARVGTYVIDAPTDEGPEGVRILSATFYEVVMGYFGGATKPGVGTILSEQHLRALVIEPINRLCSVRLAEFYHKGYLRVVIPWHLFDSLRAGLPPTKMPDMDIHKKVSHAE